MLIRRKEALIEIRYLYQKILGGRCSMPARWIVSSLRRGSCPSQHAEPDSGRGPPASLPPHLYTLLEWRLTALGINPKDIERDSPAMLAGLRGSCALCEHKRRCLEGMMDHRSPPGWGGYCPNAVAIRALSASRAFAAFPIVSVGDSRQSV